MSHRRGDVVIALFPNADGSGSKPRPVLIVQSDAYNSKIQNLVVAAITSNLKHASDLASLLIDITTPEGAASGLVQDSVVTCINLATLDARLVARTIGQLPSVLMQKVDACLRSALGLP